jgi:hypothetical protein
MSDCDRAAVHIDFIAIEPQLFFDRQILRGERFVDLDQIDIIEGQPGFLQRDLRRWDWAAPHQLRLDSRNTPAHDAPQRLDSPLSCFL